MTSTGVVKKKPATVRVTVAGGKGAKRSRFFYFFSKSFLYSPNPSSSNFSLGTKRRAAEFMQ